MPEEKKDPPKVKDDLHLVTLRNQKDVDNFFKTLRKWGDKRKDGPDASQGQAIPKIKRRPTPCTSLSYQTPNAQ